MKNGLYRLITVKDEPWDDHYAIKKYNPHTGELESVRVRHYRCDKDIDGEPVCCKVDDRCVTLDCILGMSMDFPSDGSHYDLNDLCNDLNEHGSSSEEVTLVFNEKYGPLWWVTSELLGEHTRKDKVFRGNYSICLKYAEAIKEYNEILV